MLGLCASQIRSCLSAGATEKDKVFVSVLAGCTLDQLEQAFNFMKVLKMIRTMPNTPMQVGEGCTIYSPGSYVTQPDLEKVHLLLASLGLAQQVPEKMINSIGAVTGCGPAFVSRISLKYPYYCFYFPRTLLAGLYNY